MHASTMKDLILDLCKFFFLRSPQPSASSSTRHKVNLNIQSASAFVFCVVGSINRWRGSAAGRGAHAREGREEAGGGRVASGSGRGSRGWASSRQRHPGEPSITRRRRREGRLLSGAMRYWFIHPCLLCLVSPSLPRTPSLPEHSSLPSFKCPTPIPIHTAHFPRSRCLELTAPGKSASSFERTHTTHTHMHERKTCTNLFFFIRLAANLLLS